MGKAGIAVRTLFRVALAIVLGAGPAFPAAALQADLASGERVRIRQVEGPTVTGTLVGVSASELRLTTEKDAELAVARANVGRLERSLGTHKRFGRDFGLVVVTMALAGAVVGAATWEPCDGKSLFCWSRGETALMGAGLFGAIGLPLGVIAGATGRHETWEDVPLRPREGTALRTLPVTDGARIGLVVSIPTRGF